jgi:hypothetical protein
MKTKDNDHRLLVQSKWCKTEKKENKSGGDRVVVLG